MAKHDKLKLSIAKADRSTDFSVLKYSSTERGKTVDVTVTASFMYFSFPTLKASTKPL